MAEATLLVDPADFGGNQLEVVGDSYRHLFRARRLAVGEALRVVDGIGHAREATVESVDRKGAIVRLGEPAPNREAALEVELLIAAPKPERASILVEKATELGVAAIRFFRSERTPRRYGEGTLQRLRRVSEAAVEQSGRARRPLVDGVHPWAWVAIRLHQIPRRWALVPGGQPPPRSRQQGSMAVVVGPEGGLSESELEDLCALECRSVDLGPRILRVETAGLAAAALLLAAR